MSDNRKVMFSGIKPTGDPTLGNYLGAIKNWVSLKNTYQGIFSIVDLHAITVHQNPEDLKKRSIEIAAIYFAAGIDPKENIVFIQFENGFKALEVQTGIETKEGIQIIKGLTSKDKVAKNAQYLIDSESFIKTK